jgi:hypothetical protein
MADRALLDPLANADAALRQLVQQKDDLIKLQQLRIAELELQVRPKNFPPCMPMVSHDIARDIPSNRIRFVKFMFVAYFFTCGVLILNMCLNFYIANQPNKKATSNDYSKGQWMSIAFLLGIPLAFPLWYWPLYRAVGLREGSRYVISGVTLLIAIGGGAFGLLGIIEYGSVGILYMIAAYDDKETDTPGNIALIMCILWAMQVAAMVFGFIRQVHHYRKDRTIAGQALDAANVARTGAHLI